MKKRKFIIIEDEQDYRDGMCEFLSRDGQVISYSHPDSFAEAHTETSSLEGVHLIILDFCFDGFDANDKDLVKYIKEDLCYQGKLVLWSLEESIPSHFRSQFDAILPKKLMTLPEIETCIDLQH